MRRQNASSQQTGFTLIELLISVVITAVLAVALLANYRDGQKQYVLAESVQELIFNLRQTQSMAMNGLAVAGKCSDIVPCDGYGVYARVGWDRYIIFANKKNTSYNYQSGDDPIVETIYLPEGVIIDSTTPNGSRFDACFVPPQPLTYVRDSNAPNRVGTITLGIVGSGLVKAVRVNTAGVIQVVD